MATRNGEVRDHPWTECPGPGCPLHKSEPEELEDAEELAQYLENGER